MTMRRSLSRAVLLTCMLLLPAIALRAQGGPPPPMGGMGDSPSIDVKKFNAERELARLAKRYKLTEEQRSKIRPILQDQEKQVHDLGEDESLSDRDWVAAVKRVHQETVLKLKVQLSDPQAAKYIKDEEKAAQDEEEEERQPFGPPGGGGPPPGGGGPPPGE